MRGVTHFEDRELFAHLRRRHPNKLNDFISAAWIISDGVCLASSIDDFLNIHSEPAEIRLLGKAAIIRTILEAERNSKLFVDQSNVNNKMDFSKIEGTWFLKLMRVLGPGGSPAEVAKIFESLAFIVFNYDRCVEHFLAHALKALYGIALQEAQKIVKTVTIIHPYGKIGELDRGVPFGGDGRSGEDCFHLADFIKTYTEQMEEGITLAQIRSEVERAACIVFLGFSYLEQNMTLLRPQEKIDRKPIFGTAYGMSTNDRDVVKEQILNMFTDAHRELALRLKLVELNTEIRCAQLFDYYARSLNAG